MGVTRIIARLKFGNISCWIIQLIWILAAVQASKLPQFSDFHFSIEPSDTVGYKGRTLRLDCSVTYSKSNSLSIQWLKDGEYIGFAEEQRYQLASNGSLLVSDVTDKRQETDAGYYQCSAAVDDGQTIVSRKAKVEIAGISRNFDIQPAVLLEVYLGDTAMFQCKISSIPSANISWLKDNQNLPDLTSKFRTYPEGVLEIYNVEFRDFGTYHCVAEGIDKKIKSRGAKLEQKKADVDFQGIEPEFTLKPLDTQAVAGSKVTLFCGAYGLGSQMQPPSFVWLKDGKTIDFSNGNGRITMKGKGNLQILDVKPATDADLGDSGSYMCRAENDIDSNDAEAELNVLVPPTFTNRPTNMYAHEKHDVTLSCQAAGNPPPKTSWLKNGKPLIPDDYFQLVESKNLKILGLLLSDNGYYQCVAENTVGSIQATIQLQVLEQDTPLPANPSTPSIYYHLHRSGALSSVNPKNVPGSPKNLRAAIVSTRFVTLSWVEPDRKGQTPIIGYSIRWQEKGSLRERTTNTTTQEMNIQGLKPGTEYEFRVIAVNQDGPSATPTVIRIRTKQEDDVPSEAQNVQALALSPTSIKVTWDQPAQTKGQLTKYELIYYQVGKTEEQKQLDKSVTSHTLEDLQPYQEYSFRIVAHNGNGPGMSTEEVVTRTLSDTPSGVPQNFTLEAASSLSIVVRWQPPSIEEQNGKITGYKIRYKKQGNRKGSTVTTDGDKNVYTLTELRKASMYQVRISAQTVNGSGPPTEWLYAKTFEDDLDESKVPEMPDRLVVRPLTDSLVVQWVPNRRSKYIVRGYYLGYGKGIPDVYRQVFDADTFFYTIENLQSASEYVVSIRAFNNQGEGIPRYETVFTSAETAQEPVTPMLPPIGLKATVLSANTIVVTWTDNSLGKIQRITDNRYYTLRYITIPQGRNRYMFINTTDLVCHIDELKPDTQYEFSVKVTKGKRKSTWSMSVVNTTQEAAPGSMPRDLTPVPVDGDDLAVTLNWQPPQKPNGQITGYLVFYTTDPSQDDLEWVVEGVIGEKLSMTITDLTEDTTYYFKVQARNGKGYGPMSSTVFYKTPKVAFRDRNRYRDGVVRRPVDGKKDFDVNLGYPSEKKESKDSGEKGGLSQNVMIIIIACVVGATFVIVVAVVTVILCRKRDAAERSKRVPTMYKNSPVKGKNMKFPGPPREGQPPDLFRDHDLELKNLDKAESTLTISTRRNSHDSSSIHTNNPADIYQSGSEAEERLLPPQYHQLPPQQQRNIIRPKPLKIPVDAQTHQREPIATVTAYPNGHLMPMYTPQGNRPPSPSEDSGVIPMRPVYPRTQYQMQYGSQGPPRVNAGDISQASDRLVPCMEEDGQLEAYEDSLGRVGYASKLPQFSDFHFSTEPSDTVGYKGRTLRLDCSVIYSKSNSLSIQWLKDGEYIGFAEEQRYQLASNGSLLVSDVTDKRQETDAGYYQCSAAVDDGQTIVSRKAKVEIAGISRNFDIQPAVLLEVYLGDTAMFQCKISSIPSANISWLKDNQNLPDLTSKFRTYPEGVLEIYNVEFRDFGTYHCVAEGIDKKIKSRGAKLEQKKADVDFQGIEPEFTLKPLDTQAVAGSKVTLFCGAYGLGSQMQPPSFVWLKDGKTIDFSNGNGRITMKGKGNLQILDVKPATDADPGDSGSYMCRAENDIDSNDAEAELNVLVPPTFTNRPTNVYAHEKHDVTLSCQAAGNPPPKTSWLKNGKPLIPDDYFQLVESKNLKILGLLLSDNGYYQCVAENTVGSIQATIQLQVLEQDTPLPANPSTPSIYYHLHRSGAFSSVNPKNVPGSPKNLRAAIVSTRFVTLSWAEPDRKGQTPIIGYSIRWQEKGSLRERTTNTTTQEMNIQGLKPGTEYEFRVIAVNQDGPSATPAVIRIRTKQEDDVPSEAQNVQALALSPTSIKVTWDQPAQTKGQLTKYELIYYQVGKTEEQEQLDKSVTSHTLEDLQPYQEYSFRIVAHNGNGPGMSTEEVVTRTLSDTPSGVPQNFTLEAASSLSIVVRWQPPSIEEQNGKITGYKIRYKKQGNRKGSTVTTDGDKNVYTLTELRKASMYQVRISAQTVNGSGPPTEWLYAKTFEDDLDESKVPEMPDRLVVRPLTDSLVVQWVPNRRSKYIVRGYYLGYGKGIPDVYRQVFDADTFFYTIENLQPASEYVVSIRAFNNQGEGIPRYETVFTSAETAQEPVTPMLPPIGLKATVLSANTIVVTWTDNSLGKIQRITDNRYYTLRYITIPQGRNRYMFINTTDLVCHIDELKPDTQYEFSVKVTKGKRKSTWSMSVVNTTQEAAPGSMPRDLTPVPVDGDDLAVTLNWQPPQKPNGQITGYLVFYTTDPSQDDLEWVVEGVIGEKLSMTITDLTEDTTYYFKVQARNGKGYGPMSSTVFYKTPKVAFRDRNRYRDGVVRRPLDGKKDFDLNLGYPSEKKESKDSGEKGGLSQNVMIIIIACVVGATFVIVVAVVTVILCRKRDAAERSKRVPTMYKNSPVKGKNMKFPGPPREGQPPDLFRDHDLELKNLDKAESTLTISTRRNSHDSSSIHTNNQADIYQSGSEAEERLLPPQYHQLPPQQQRNIIRPKPLKIPVDAQTHQREPIATVTAYPNGHLMPMYTPQGNHPPSPSEDSGVIPMRPVYPRTQYQMQYGSQGPPRVNAGDISQASDRLVPCMEEDGQLEAYEDSLGRVGYGFRSPDYMGSLTRRKHPDRAPVTGIASPVKPVQSSEFSSGSLGRGGNPLKTFSVPDPPLQQSTVPSTTPKHIVKPQQSIPATKKTPISSGPIKPRALMQPMTTSKSPVDGPLKPGKEDQDIQKSLSTEELTAEMANLEGLMKDLNAITQQDFEC